MKPIKAKNISYVVENYVDANTNNECELFYVTEDGVKVYERDYGSTGGGIKDYIEDFIATHKKYIVTTKRTYVSKYTIEASSIEEAEKIVDEMSERRKEEEDYSFGNVIEEYICASKI